MVAKLFRRGITVAACVAASFVTSASPAFALPVSAFAFLGAFAAVGAVVANTLVFQVLSSAFNSLFAQKPQNQERQASVVALSIGEVAREVIFGRVSTGNAMIDPA